MKLNKKITLALCATAMCASAWAVQAKRMSITHTQSDGASITVTLSGDEWNHGHVTQDGLLVRQNGAGDWCYVTTNGLSNVVAHNAQDRTASEAQYAANSAITLQQQAQHTSARRARAMVSASEIETETQVPHMGTPRIPVIMVNYQDYKFKGNDPVELFKDHFMGDGKSANKYFEDQSFGKFSPKFDVLGLVELENERKVYGGNDYYGNDMGLGNMVAEACLALGDGVDWSLYDNDEDGLVDVVIVVYAGTGEAQSSIAEAVWPCQWDLASSDYDENITIGGTTISKFAVFNELYGTRDSGTQVDGIGTFCHEFSHCIGLPDWYATNNMGYYGMGNWSLMDYGCYNDDGRTPTAYTAYERNFLGWMDIEEATPNSIYTLTPVTEGGKAYKITNDQDPTGNEYFIIECRKQSGWDSFMPSSGGMMVTHVDYSEKAWADNTVNNNGQRKRMTTVPADNKQSYANEEGDLFPYGDHNEFTDDSSPAARTYVGSGSIKRLHKPITDIIKNDDGSVTLKFMYTAPPALPGDVDGNGVVDITDLNILLNIILGKDSADNYDGRADLTGDNDVDISDANAAVNKILGK